MDFWSPLTILIVTFGAVIGFGAVFCYYAFRGYAPLQFHCRCCDIAFRRKPYRGPPLSPRPSPPIGSCKFAASR